MVFEPDPLTAGARECARCKAGTHQWWVGREATGAVPLLFGHAPEAHRDSRPTVADPPLAEERSRWPFMDRLLERRKHR